MRLCGAPCLLPARHRRPLRALAPSLAGRPLLQGPHASRECLPLSLILRDRLKYALTRKESLMIVMKKSIKVDGKVR